ncbi:hypothetical protein OK016_01045 [Vibrio chagasii]|nr:hypothetical protein [Vibrio chagasii]
MQRTRKDLEAFKAYLLMFLVMEGGYAEHNRHKQNYTYMNLAWSHVLDHQEQSTLTLLQNY